jgi:putative DNA primase/helicase
MSGAAPRAHPDDAEEQFRDALADRDIVPPHRLIADGKLHRCDAAGRGGKGDAAYVLHLDGIPAGGIENWRDGLGWQAWRADLYRELTPTERADLTAKAAAHRHEREQEEQRRHTEAQAKAQGIWEAARAAPRTHPYLVRKGIKPHRARITPGHEKTLIVPVTDLQGELSSLQFIAEDGAKRFLMGGAVSARCCMLGEAVDADVIVIAEGFATAASINEATGYAVVVGFNCNNLPPTAEAIRTRYPAARIIIAADDDHLTIGNPGVTKAKEAAAAVNGLVAIPLFGPNRPEKAKDFNDLSAIEGHDAVCQCIEAALGTSGTHWDKRDTGTRKLLALNVIDFLSREIPPREMLLAPILPTQGLLMLYSWRGVGKTHTAIGMAYAVASGGSFLRWKAPTARRVLYLDGEMPAGVMQERIAAAAEASVTEPPTPDHLRIITPDIQPDGMPNLATEDGRAAVEEWIVDGCDLLVLDNISTLCRLGKENESESWEPMQTWLLDLRRRGISVLLVHHAGKGGTQRGTSKREDILDTVINLRRPDDYNPTEGARFEIHLDKSRGVFGAEALPFEARLEARDGAAAFWTMRNIDDVTLARASALFAEGSTVRDVAEELSISRSAAGRLKKKLGGEP